MATAFSPPAPRLVWNGSASSPRGLYLVERVGGPRRGEMVIARLPKAARQLAAERRYLPRNVPLVKRVVAVGGDRVCAGGAAIFVNGRRLASRRKADPAGRPMPWWTGCKDLGEDTVFLLSADVPEAFDGRYFGVTPGKLVVGRARLLWPR